MSKHYLCAIDLTHPEDAKAVLVAANKMASQDEALLSLVTVIPDYGMTFVGSFFKDGTMKAAADAANKALHDLADEAIPGHGHVQCITAIGNVYEEVLEAARKCKADHIIVGAHKPDFADRIMGPNAARITRYAKVSVTALRL